MYTLSARIVEKIEHILGVECAEKREKKIRRSTLLQ